MKRFNLLRFVFALVCGCHINGVKSQTCSAGKYLNVKGICTDLPYDDKSPVVKAIPEPERCGAFDTTLKVKKYEYTQTLPWFIPKLRRLKDCQRLCLSDRNCTHFEYDKNSRNCSYIVKESFGTKEQNIVSGYGECPKNDKCLNFGNDYVSTIVPPWRYKTNITSPKDCQELCRRNDRPTVFGYRFSDKHSNIVNRDCYCLFAKTFDFVPSIDWISGDSYCPPCFFYDIKLRNLRIVGNGGKNPYLKKPTVGACQRSCKNNRLCTVFEYDRTKEECRHKNFITGEMKKDNVVYGSRYCNCDCNKNGVHGCSNDDVCHCKPGYQGPKCDQCVDEYYMPDRNAKICYPCNCDSNGSINRNCDQTGQCSCQQNKWFTGKKCDTCVNGKYMTNNACQDCNCDVYGSESQSCNVTSGQCPCWFDSYAGLRCDQCVSTQIKANGRCCFKGDYYNLKAGRCENCNCFLRGSDTWLCHLYPGGQCQCRSTYKGRRCDDVNERTIAGGSKDFLFDGLYHRVIAIECSPPYYCDILSVRTTNSAVFVYLEGTPTITKNKGETILYTSNFCFGTTPTSKRKGDAVCKAGGKNFSGTSNSKTAYFHLFSNNGVQLGGVKLAVKISNFKQSTFLAKADIPLEPNP